MDREITIPSPNDNFENAFGSLAILKAQYH